MGFVIELAFQSVMFGAQAAGLSMGLGFASLVDPQNGVQTGMPGQLFMLLMTLLYLATDTHLALIALLGESFQVVPVGMDGLTRHGFGVLFGWTAEVFQSGFRIALPALVALTLVNVAFGVVTRAAPQLNIFGVGFPITLVLGIVILWAAIEVLPPLFGELLDGGIETVGMALETP